LTLARERMSYPPDSNEGVTDTDRPVPEPNDQGLRDDMIKLGAPKAVANLYYYGVRIGGAAGTGLPWQWGFGQK